MMTAGIRNLPVTLQDRSIIIPLQRALAGEVREHIRDGECPVLQECARKLARWGEDCDGLPDVDLPPGFHNRTGDNWRPLFAIAQLAGGEWPARVLAAATASLVTSEQGLIATLLADIHEVFGEKDRVTSQALVDGLSALEEKPYGEINRGRAITTNWLANQLKGVITDGSQTIRSTGKKTAKGYYRRQFADPWRRYGVGSDQTDTFSAPPETAVTAVTTSQPAETLDSEALQSVTPETSQRNKSISDDAMLRCDGMGVTVEGPRNPSETLDCDGVTAVTPISPPSETTPDREEW
jgi:hypothetical protein